MFNFSIVLIVLLVIILLIAAFIIGTYNSLVRLREMIANARGQIAAQMESRWDAITNLIQATKQYTDYEEKVFQEVTERRASIGKNSSVEELEKEETLYQRAVGQINAVAENYPNLRAGELYQNTMTSVNEWENKVRHSRMLYNDSVTKYNRQLKTFPTNLIAAPFGFMEESYFENTETKAEMPQW